MIFLYLNFSHKFLVFLIVCLICVLHLPQFVPPTPSLDNMVAYTLCLIKVFGSISRSQMTIIICYYFFKILKSL